MNIVESFKMALIALWANKLRSFLTMFGVIIGVAAVVSLVSIGQGVKNDIEKQIVDLGSNLLFVIPGKIETTRTQQQISPNQFLSGNILTEKDVDTIKKTDGVLKVAPITLFSGALKYNNKISTRAILIGTTPEIKGMTNFKITEGRFLENSDDGKYVVSLGKVPKEELFGKETAIGKKVIINKKEFDVVGVFEKPGTSNILGGEEFQSFVTIPFETVKNMTGSAQIFRILIKVKEDKDIKDVAKIIRNKLLENHGGEEDFSVLTQEDLLSLLGMILNLMTMMITAIASISLIVGGIGIMNIMLVSVTERTREIGLRKAVGATSGAILLQFLIEAVILTLFGGVLGVLFSYIGINIIDTKTTLNPILTPQTVVLAFGVCVFVGIIFGLLPAIRASQLDPIKALRYE